MKPNSIKQLEFALSHTEEESSNQVFKLSNQLDISISGKLLSLGIRTSRNGYWYLRTAIILAYFFPDITEYVTKTLCPPIARISHTTIDCVARSCRSAIETAYTIRDNEYFINYFEQYGISRKPSLSEFVRIVSSELRKNEQFDNCTDDIKS